MRLLQGGAGSAIYGSTRCSRRRPDIRFQLNKQTWIRLRARWEAFRETRRGRFVVRTIRALFLLSILAYLAVELTRVGWGRIWTALPTEPLFYVLFLALYFSIPVTETFIYRVTWTFDAVRSLPVFLKKRVYNRDVLGYAGEVYFFSWAQANLGHSRRFVAETIRDNNIISSVASTGVAALLLSVFLTRGKIGLADVFGDANIWYLVLAAVVLVLLVPVWIRYRKFLFTMKPKVAAAIFSMHTARLLLGQALQIGMWVVVMPEVSLDIWFTYAAVSIILSRIPFVPNQNLIFLGAGVELSSRMDIATPEVAGMLLVMSILDKLLNAILFGVISASGSDKDTEPDNGSESPGREAESDSGSLPPEDREEKELELYEV